ncbi:MAG: alcohol dehydrogenase catalytic domain-containing protein [Capsulimonadales bacterium]|nr:alcohol dehydrogenase catalytic domain-containing protein [Capsulimonadales bacterium]
MPDSAAPLLAYKEASLPLPASYRRWHLYGAGLENVGRDGRPEEIELPSPGPDELLVRHDACGICYSDIKIINLGGDHPRLVGRDLNRNPVVMGHEVALTVVAVGSNLTEQVRIGERYIVQADIYYKGVNLAYGYALSGGMSEYGLIGPEVLRGDEGNYLLPIAGETGYAEAALVEPWACVEAAYHWHTPEFPTPDEPHIPLDVPGASAIGHGNPPVFQWLRFTEPPDPDDFERLTARLARPSICRLEFAEPLSRPVRVDIGRIHYDGLFFVGPKENHRSELKAGGTAWFIGTAGPMGMMHVQRALSLPHPPRRLIGTDRNDDRIAALKDRFGPLAEERGVELLLFNVRTEGLPDLNLLAPNGFDDIVVMVPSIPAIEEAYPYLGQDGVMNVFAGVARGTTATLDIYDIVARNVRIVGTSGSTIADMRMVRDKLESGQLDTGASVAAIGGLDAFREGLDAVRGSRFPGKTVIFPHIPDLPLTALSALKEVRPAVYARLKEGRFWTREAEEELIRESLPTEREAR